MYCFSSAPITIGKTLWLKQKYLIINNDVNISWEPTLGHWQKTFLLCNPYNLNFQKPGKICSLYLTYWSTCKNINFRSIFSQFCKYTYFYPVLKIISISVNVHNSTFITVKYLHIIWTVCKFHLSVLGQKKLPQEP